MAGYVGNIPVPQSTQADFVTLLQLRSLRLIRQATLLSTYTLTVLS